MNVQNEPIGSATRADQLHQLLFSPDMAFLMEAHNGLSAKIVEEAGFSGIWASGLSISAALGVRDNNEASWTQVLDVLEFMADATRLPILMDGDTGYGNFNNMRRLVRKLEQRGIAGVAIEDKLFPKTNSFIGDGQPLADIEEFCGKIKAGKESQRDDRFCIVARVEALIAGWGLDEALRRAEAYHRAGADAILIHSKKSEPDEILAFTREWGGRSPVVIVPTMYYSTPTSVFRAHGISTVIWANHNLRASVTAMRSVARRIYATESLVEVEREIASVREVFALQNNDELQQAEARYLPKGGADAGAVILAASRGAKLGPMTEDRPKCMLDIRGIPLLRRLVGIFNGANLRRVTVVRGYRKETVAFPGIQTVDNDEYEATGELWSLDCARAALGGPTIIAYGDILFRQEVLDGLLRSRHDVTLVVDAGGPGGEFRSASRLVDRVVATRPHTGRYLDDEALTGLVEIGEQVTPGEEHGEWIGLLGLSAAGAVAVAGELAVMRAEGSLRGGRLPDLIRRLKSRDIDVGIQYIRGNWLDVDDAYDLAAIRNVV